MANRKKSMFALCAATAMILCTTSAFATDAPVDSDVDFDISAVADVEVFKTGTYNIRPKSEDGAGPNVAYTVTAVKDAHFGVTYDDLDFFTAEEYEAYLEEQKTALLDEIKSGALSQETYGMTIADMEEVLAGIKAGTTMASKPIVGADGCEREYVTVTYTGAEGFEIQYGVDEDGTMTVTIGDVEYGVEPVSEK